MRLQVCSYREISSRYGVEDVFIGENTGLSFNLGENRLTGFSKAQESHLALEGVTRNIAFALVQGTRQTLQFTIQLGIDADSYRG